MALAKRGDWVSAQCICGCRSSVFALVIYTDNTKAKMLYPCPYSHRDTNGTNGADLEHNQELEFNPFALRWLVCRMYVSPDFKAVDLPNLVGFTSFVLSTDLKIGQILGPYTELESIAAALIGNP